MSRAVSAPRFDPGDPAVALDPYPVYDRIRSESALCRIAPGTWGVTRHADVSALLRDPRLGSEFPTQYHRMSAGDGPAASFFERIVLYRDPPTHTRLRRLLGAAFTPAAVREARPRIAALVDELLAEPLARGSFDAVATLSFPLPVLVVCELMGIERRYRDEVRDRASDLGKAFAAVVPDSDRAEADAAVVWLRGFISELLDERGAGDPSGHLLDRLLAAEWDGARLTHDEIVDNAVFAFFAGFETTMNLLSAAFAHLGRDTGAQQELRADRTLMAGTIEELLRIEPPIQGTARLLREPVEIDGHRLSAGRVLVLLIGSANRDPDVFTEPDRLDLRRTPNPHVSFGGGPHLCMGAALARAEAEIVLDYVLDRCTGFVVDTPPERRTAGIRAFHRVQVTVDR